MLLATGLILTYAPGLSAFASPSTEASLSVQQSAKKYEGVMVDVNTGEPLIGASIQIKGTLPVSSPTSTAASRLKPSRDRPWFSRTWATRPRKSK